MIQIFKSYGLGTQWTIDVLPGQKRFGQSLPRLESYEWSGNFVSLSFSQPWDIIKERSGFVFILSFLKSDRLLIALALRCSGHSDPSFSRLKTLALHSRFGNLVLHRPPAYMWNKRCHFFDPALTYKAAKEIGSNFFATRHREHNASSKLQTC
jgi:hypothetical protein